MENYIKDNFVNEEIEKSVQKIKNLFSYGIQQSSCVFIPEEKVCRVSFQTSFEPFHIHEKAKEATQNFHEVLESIMEQRQLPQYLYKILQDQKHETALILEQYDLVISELSKSLTEYDKEYRQKCEKHSSQHELLEENIEALISEINRIGKEEIQNIRASIIQNTKAKTEKNWEKCQNLLDKSAADIPFDEYLWKPPTTMLSFEELVNTFSLPQVEVVTKRRNMLVKICELKKGLEREKLKCALKLEKLEKELFEMKENYKRKKLIFSKLKRKHNKFIVERKVLSKQLKDIQKNIERECEVQKKMLEKQLDTKKVRRYLQNEDKLIYDSILKERYIETYNLLCDVMHLSQFIMEHILGLEGISAKPEGFELHNRNILPYICKKQFWMDFINAAPKDCFIHDITKVMEDFWYHLKINSDWINRKKSLWLENKELQIFLKHYYIFEKTTPSS